MAKRIAFCCDGTDRSLANSVLIRCGNDASFRPGNLTFTDKQLARQYKIVDVVAAAPVDTQVAATAAG